MNATDMERTDFVSPRTEPEPVLVVDDEHGVRDLMARWLRLSGYSIVAAATADEAIERVQRDSIGVALVDIHMPGHDGHWLTEQLRRRSPDIAVIMVTGLLDVSAACTSLQHGVIDYLVKPFGRDRLREAVQRGFDWRRTAMHERRWREELDSETERLRRNLSEAFAALNIDSYDSLDAVLQMLTLRERDLYDHAHRVETLSMKLAEALGWHQLAGEPLRRAALLHDIGRLALPPVLFRKTGPLSPDEQVLVREGPHFAYELLRCCPFLTDAADIVSVTATSGSTAAASPAASRAISFPRAAASWRSSTPTTRCSWRVPTATPFRRPKPCSNCAAAPAASSIRGSSRRSPTSSPTRNTERHLSRWGPRAILRGTPARPRENSSPCLPQKTACLFAIDDGSRCRLPLKRRLRSRPRARSRATAGSPERGSPGSQGGLHASCRSLVVSRALLFYSIRTCRRR